MGIMSNTKLVEAMIDKMCPEDLPEYLRMEQHMIAAEGRGHYEVVDAILNRMDEVYWKLSDSDREFLNSRKVEA